MTEIATNPIVSIIVRTKDRPKLLRRALQSIAAQTFRPIEVVLVNDGGCDLDIEELKAILGDVSLNYIRLEKNTGRAHAGNVGIENARGEYIGFLDDDDEFYPEHVETLVGFLWQSDYKIAYADVEMVIQEFASEEGKMVDIIKSIFSKDFSYNDLLVVNYLPFNSIIFSKEVLNSTRGLDESFELYEDWDFLIRIGEKYPFYHIKKITARYNQWNKNLQINRSDEGRINAMHLAIINKHRTKISPEMILNIYREKEKLNREKDSRILQMEDVIKEKNSRILQMEDVINGIRGSLGWQMLESFRRYREKVLPPDTMRRKMYDYGIKSIKVLKDQGLKIFSRKVRGKIRSIFYEKKTRAVPEFLPLNINSSDLLHFPSKRNFNVLFLKGDWAGLTNHYRVYNMVEYLQLNNIHSEVVDLFDLPSKIPDVYRFDLVIIHRIPMDPSLEQFIKTCKELGIVVIFDLDDYLFEPSIIHLIEWINHVQPTEREQLIEHLKQCKQTFDMCDYFICPTNFLAKKAEEAGKEAYVIRNGFDRELMHISLKALEEKSHTKADNIIRIGYFSGTKTHQKDFHSIAPAILRILHEYGNVHLYICGLLDLDYRFDLLSSKVEKTPFVPLEQLPYRIAKVDINIVPLEGGNIFCEAKSELKYFYAGILKIPTIATPTDAFAFAIKNGENGFLPLTVEEWYTCLKALIEDSALRKTMGEKAFSHVMNTYTPEVLAGSVRAVYEDIIDKVRTKNNISEFSISVSFLVSDIADNLLRYPHLLEIAEILSKRGHFVKIYFFRPNGGTQKLSCSSKVHIVEGTDSILSSDVLISTDPYNSAAIAYQNKDRTASLVYLRMNDNYGEIPYQWSRLFDEITYSSNPDKVVDEIENIVWKRACLRKS